MKKLGEVAAVDGGKVARIYRDAEWGEFVVRLIVDGAWQPDADYHTDDREDAFSTAEVMVGVRLDLVGAGFGLAMGAGVAC